MPSVDSLAKKAEAVLKGGRKDDEGPMGALLSYIDNLQKKSPPVQMAAGGGAGLITGYLFTKGSKLTATVLGVTLITFQVSLIIYKKNHSKLP